MGAGLEADLNQLPPEPRLAAQEIVEKLQNLTSGRLDLGQRGWKFVPNGRE